MATSFDYPVGKPYVTEANDGDGYYDYQDFGSNRHLGEDWNGEGGGDSDLGQSVWAVATGTIIYAQNAGQGWGNVIVIEHRLPDDTKVQSLYGHLDAILTSSGDVVKGQQIGTIGRGYDYGNGKYDYPAHLHFEIRTNIQLKIPGPGYGKDLSGRTNPSTFIDSHRVLATDPIALDDTFVFSRDGGYPYAIAQPGLLANDSIPVDAGVSVELIGAPQSIYNAGRGGLIFGPSPDFVGSVTFRYRLVTQNGASNTANVTIDVREPNHAPTATFSMSASGQSGSAGSEFRVLADSPSGQARVTFTDESTDPDGLSDIASRVWTVNTQQQPLSIGDQQFTWGFGPGGPYNVTLTVTDRAGAVALSTQSIVVLPADTRIWPMSGGNPSRQGLSAFQGPAFAPSRLWTFSTTAPVVGDLTVSAEGRIYFAGDKLYALERDGSIYASAVLPAVPGFTSPYMSSPAIDDENGFVYVGARRPEGTWDLWRFTKQLTHGAVVAHGDYSVYGMTNLIVHRGAVFFAVTGPSFITQAYAAGAVNWTSDVCSGYGGGWYGAPAIGADGSVYGVCGTILPGPIFAAKLVKLDGQTGTLLRDVVQSPGVTELMIDGQGNIRSGYQAFTGAIFVGGYLRWDSELNPLGGTHMDYTTSRSSLLPDGTSTVKVGYRFGGESILNARGAVEWNLHLLSEHGTTVPSVDSGGTIFVGNDANLLAVRSTDGAILWQVQTDGPVITQPVVAGNNLIYVGTSNGTVMAFIHWVMEL